MRSFLLGLLSFAICALSAPFAHAQSPGFSTATQSLRLAIEDLSKTFPDKYKKGPEFLKRLADLEKRQPAPQSSAKADPATLQTADALTSALAALRFEALTANPLISAQPIVFVTRKQYAPDHHNTETIFQTGECNTRSFRPGAALKTVDFGKGGEVKTLLSAPEGIVRDPEVHFSAKKMLVSLRRNINEDSHIYELNADGSGLKALTGAPGVNDIDPLYLPDGGIVFSSTREPKFCMCNIHIMANLYRMDGDGANIVQIGKSTLFEGHSALMPDGRILYDRWEYVDRNFGDAQALWTVNPDGTNHAIFYGNNTSAPGGVIEGKPLSAPGQVLAVLGSCHDRPWGALAIINRNRGVDGRDPVVQTWPASAAQLVTTDGNGKWDAFTKIPLKYEDPWPLSDKYFLCSRMTGNPNNKEEMGIYLLDIFGNELLLHTEAPGCFSPRPLAARPVPPAIPARRDYENKEGTFFIADVYRGTHMQGVKPGSVKYVRVVESPEKRFWTNPAWGGQGVERPAMNWHDFSSKRILGTVPVEADGSVSFSVPSDTFVFFQLLDENGMMIQSMRSGTMVQSGEKAWCLGCHEDRLTATPASLSGKYANAFSQPKKLQEWHGPTRVFNYLTEVQPVLDKACVRCHDFGNKPGDKINLAADRDLVFNASYIDLWRLRQTGAIGAGPAQIQQAYSWGSHKSPLISLVRHGHKGVKLDPESLDRLITWVDLNAPYYPEYASAYPDNLAGRSPLSQKQLKTLEELTGVPLEKLSNYGRKLGPQVSFERPELSPCLQKIAVPAKRAEALAIIQAGKAALDTNPNPDKPGFKMCEKDAAREKFYQERRAAEMRNRQAIREGKKIYDPNVGR